jgi:hypothetical protein
METPTDSCLLRNEYYSSKRYLFSNNCLVSRLFLIYSLDGLDLLLYLVEVGGERDCFEAIDS